MSQVRREPFLRFGIIMRISSTWKIFNKGVKRIVRGKLYYCEKWKQSSLLIWLWHKLPDLKHFIKPTRIRLQLHLTFHPFVIVTISKFWKRYDTLWWHSNWKTVIMSDIWESFSRSGTQRSLIFWHGTSFANCNNEDFNSLSHPPFFQLPVHLEILILSADLTLCKITEWHPFSLHY